MNMQVNNQEITLAVGDLIFNRLYMCVTRRSNGQKESCLVPAFALMQDGVQFVVFLNENCIWSARIATISNEYTFRPMRQGESFTVTA